MLRFAGRKVGAGTIAATSHKPIHISGITAQRPWMISADVVFGRGGNRQPTPGLEQVPAIALTGYAREEDRELAMIAGYNAHLAKPAEIGYLLYLMKQLTRR